MRRGAAVLTPDAHVDAHAGAGIDLLALPTVAGLGGTESYLTASDGTRIRYAAFPPGRSKPAGVAVLLPGYTEFIEKHLETVADLQARGHGVLVLDWRGQGLSDRALDDRHKGYIASMDLFLDDLEAVLEVAGLAHLPGPHWLLGFSMGGHLALRAAQRDPDRFDRLVLISPMIDIAMVPWLEWTAPLVARLAVFAGCGPQYLPGGGPYGVRNRTFEGNALTSDHGRFRRVHALIDRDPDLAIGGPTFGWVEAALDSIGRSFRADALAQLHRPILLVSAGRERIVSNVAQERLVSRLADCRMVVIEDALHEILNETDALRAEAWRAIDAFLPG